MCYLRVGVGNRKTGMKMTGVCFNYDEFWKDVQKTAECDFHKDDNSPTECYHEKLADIMGEVWKGKKTLPIVFSIRLSKYVSLVDEPIRYTFAIVDKDFFKRTYRKEEIDEEALKECLSKDTDCIVFYSGMNR